jgi:plastocyanin
MKRLAATLLTGIVLMLAACGGGSSSGPPTLTMVGSNFTGNTNLTIKAGQSVTFKDESGSHIISTGHDQKYIAEPGAPAALNTASGVPFSPGEVKAFTFSTPGTYQITCQVHPDMNATITVTK